MTSRYKILVWAGCAQLSSQVTKYTKKGEGKYNFTFERQLLPGPHKT